LGLLKGTRTRDKAIATLGRLGGGDPHAPFRNRLLSTLFSLASTKDIDLHFAVGEALARIGGAPPSERGVAAGLAPLPPVKPPKKVGVALDTQTSDAAAASAALAAKVTLDASSGGALMGYLLAKLLQQYVVEWAPLVRQAACAWLLSLLKAAGDHPELRAHAAEIQRALVGLLSDSNEVRRDHVSLSISASSTYGGGHFSDR
jgi:proteasome component ECM29